MNRTEKERQRLSDLWRQEQLHMGLGLSNSSGGMSSSNYITTTGTGGHLTFNDGSSANFDSMYSNPAMSEENSYYANKIVKMMTAAHPRDHGDKVPMSHIVSQALSEIDHADPLNYMQLLSKIDQIERGVKTHVLEDKQADEEAQGFFSRVFGTKRKYNEEQFAMNTYVELCRNNGARSFFIFSQDAVDAFLPQIEEMGKIAVYLSGDPANYNIGVGLLTHFNNG